MFDSEDSFEVLDLSKTSTIKNDPFAQIMALKRLTAMDLKYAAKMEHNLSFDSGRNSIKIEPESSLDSRSLDGSEHSKGSPETSFRCGSNHSSESIDTLTSRGRVSSAKPVVKDEFYLERRRKNNQAAKKSRDAKRQREQQLRNQLVLLQHENQQMKRVLENCVCRAIVKGRGFIGAPYDFGGSYPDSHYLSLATDLRSIETGKVL